MEYLLTIDQGLPRPLDASLVGGKAAQLALGARDGLPVPRTLVLTADAFPGREWLEGQAAAGAQQRGRATRDYLEGLGIDVLAALQGLAAYEFAVRSSATSEDMQTASFAGSFETRLRVSPERIFGAINDVWMSTFTDRVERYMVDRGHGDDFPRLKMAVAIQKLISPILSGVALSHPLGRRDTPYISVGVVEGLGEALVSGSTDPQTFLMERGTWTLVQVQNASVSGVEIVYETAAAIGSTIVTLELTRGCPQDVEFAIDRDMNFILLQNRPIVASTASAGDRS